MAAPRPPLSRAIDWDKDLLTADEVERCYPPEKRRDLGHYVDFIQKAGVRLALPIRSIATAVVYFQRYFAFEAFDDELHSYLIAETALFAAAKNEEEDPRSMRDVINVGDMVQHPGEDALEISGDYRIMKEDMTNSEHDLFRGLHYNFNVELPHHFVLHLCKHCKLPKQISQLAWCIANDSLRCVASLRYPAHSIAAACVHIALVIFGSHSQFSHLLTDSEWWAECGVPRQHVEEIGMMILRMYERFDVAPEGKTPRSWNKEQQAERAKGASASSSSSASAKPNSTPFHPAPNYSPAPYRQAPYYHRLLALKQTPPLYADMDDTQEAAQIAPSSSSSAANTEKGSSSSSSSSASSSKTKSTYFPREYSYDPKLKAKSKAKSAVASSSSSYTAAADDDAPPSVVAEIARRAKKKRKKYR